MMRHLGPGGYLFIGNAEYIPFLEDVLEPVSRTVYRVRRSGR
jgi:chemotaxis methyl-accepting protein methylase